MVWRFFSIFAPSNLKQTFINLLNFTTMKNFDSNDFYDALIEYGELEHDELMELTNGTPIIINGREVDSILDDGGLNYSYIAENGVAYSTRLNLEDIDECVCGKIYAFLCENRNTNTDFFNSL